MTSAIDTNVLLDVLDYDPVHGPNSAAVLDHYARQGPLIVNEVVFAELSARRPGPEDVRALLSDLAISLQPSSARALSTAGSAWGVYSRRRRPGFRCPGCGAATAPTCASCGRTLLERQDLVADFIIGAHAVVHADRLITRDRGFYSRYFPQLTLA